MRVLRLGLDDGRAVDLHPAVSVVTALSGPQRNALRRSFTAIGAGLAPTPGGLVEAHGLLLDAAQDDLDLLDIANTAASSVVTAAEIPGVPGGDADRLRDAERRLVLAAADRAASLQRLVRAEALRSTVPPSDLERAAVLRARIARHESRDPEVVRLALDQVRDADADDAPDLADLVRALADVGLDTSDLGVPAGELVRMAEDWLDERAREGEWAVGAHVELQAIEDAGAPVGAGPAGGDPELEELRHRASRAARDHADAVALADDIRGQLVARHGPRPHVGELQAHLVARVAEHRPQRLAGAVPLLLDGVLEHLDGADVAPLLDRVSAAAGPVQLVVVDEHPAAAAWAETCGVRRAAVVSPVVEDGSSAPA